MTTEQINKTLQIVNVNGKMFKRAAGGVWQMKNVCAFYNPCLGYLSFTEDGGETPYTPSGGKKALQAILNAGGLTNFDNVVWLQEIKEKAPAQA